MSRSSQHLGPPVCEHYIDIKTALPASIAAIDPGTPTSTALGFPRKAGIARQTRPAGTAGAMPSPPRCRTSSPAARRGVYLAARSPRAHPRLAFPVLEMPPASGSPAQPHLRRCAATLIFSARRDA
jgi:hypothetical protein